MVWYTTGLVVQGDQLMKQVRCTDCRYGRESPSCIRSGKNVHCSRHIRNCNAYEPQPEQELSRSTPIVKPNTEKPTRDVVIHPDPIPLLSIALFESWIVERMSLADGRIAVQFKRGTPLWVKQAVIRICLPS